MLDLLRLLGFGLGILLCLWSLGGFLTSIPALFAGAIGQFLVIIVFSILIGFMGDWLIKNAQK